MKANEIAQLSLKDLRALREKLDDAIAVREQQERADVKAKLTDLASKAGFSVGELFGAPRQKRSSSMIKYRNPQDPAQTWTGRGRKPTWIVKAGGDIERFRV